MKAKLTFDMNDHDDRMEHERCVKATGMAIALFDITINMKKQCENWADMQEKPISSQDVIDYVFDQITDVMEEQNININDILE